MRMLWSRLAIVVWWRALWPEQLSPPPPRACIRHHSVSMGQSTSAEALMLPPGGVTAATLAWGSLGMVGLAVSVAGTTVQFHHLVAFVFHICGLH